MAKVNRRSAVRPAKPRPDFPLFPHARGYWAKKVRGKLEYFGRIDADPKGEAALNAWLDKRDDLLAGRTPRVTADGLTMRDLANRFLSVKKSLVDNGELTEHTFRDYHETCERLLSAFGKTRLVADLAADDFESLRASLGKTWGPVAVGNEVNRIRIVFRYGYEAGLIDKPMRFGPGFKRPSRKVLLRHRQQRPKKMFSDDEVRAMIDKADQQLKAMILLAINAGLGNNDVGLLENRHLDLKAGWLDYPRPKTGVERRCPLWPETIAAVKAAIAKRHKPKDHAHDDLVFVTKYGGCWAKDTSDNPISNEMAKLLANLKIQRKGVNFYSLRHTFATVGGGCRDQVAVNFIMGHAARPDDMSAVYREHIDDDRLKGVTDHVRSWLFPVKKSPKTTKANKPAKRTTSKQ